MSLKEAVKPEIIVVSVNVDPHRGSEPGKGWWWSCALSQYFRLHVITDEYSKSLCEKEALVQEAGWTFHAIEQEIDWTSWSGYWRYRAWLKLAMARSMQVIAEVPIKGLCHITLGSFRVLPRYDRLGVPYILGPLGGGECSPFLYTWERATPFRDKIAETMRPIFNDCFAFVPSLRTCLSKAEIVLTTSEETDRVVRRMGAAKTAIVCPDSFDTPVDSEKVAASRLAQKGEINKCLRLLWQGRALWWKGPDLALMILRQALNSGLTAELTMVSDWNSPVGVDIQKFAQKIGVDLHVKWASQMSRVDFLTMLSAHHGFLATSLHDSGGIPLIEAQAFGLPCITTGLGGLKLSACPKAGVSRATRTIQEFVDKAVGCLANWQQHPEVWLEESKRAFLFGGRFTKRRLEKAVLEHIVPRFNEGYRPASSLETDTVA